jgi:hypothetical protein
VLEFIELEHTAKNLLLRAVRRSDDLSNAASVEKYRELKRSLGLDEIAPDRIVTAERESRTVPGEPPA